MSQIGTFARRHFEPLMLAAQVLIDLVVVLFACFIGFELVEASVGGYGSKVPPQNVLYQLWALTAAVCLVTFHFFGMYSPVKSLLNVEEFKAIAKSTTVSFFVLFTLIVFMRTAAPTRTENLPVLAVETVGAAGATAGLEALGGEEVAKPEAEGFMALIVFLKEWHRRIDFGPDSRFNPDSFPRLAALLSFILILLLTTASRFFSFKAIQSLHRRGIGNRNVLIYGTGETGQWLQRKFLLVPTLGLRLVGLLSEDAEEVGRRCGRSSVLGTFDDLERLVREHKIHEVFIALPETEEERVMTIIEAVERLGLSFRVVPRFYHLMSQRVRIENLDSIPLITRPERRQSLVTSAGKRCLDIAFSATVLLLCLPLFAVTAILIRRESPGPVFFRQIRVGRNGKLFRMIKFRTMYTHLSGDAVKPKDSEDPRITRIGRHLRRYSLDELPQFFNVLLGDMSVVGPRPEMPFIVDGYGALQRERLRAKPGITGLWQISYHRQEAIHENLDYDVYYVENQSLLLDVVIIALTMVAVVKGTGAH